MTLVARRRKFLLLLAVLVPTTVGLLWWAAGVQAEQVQRRRDRVERERSVQALVNGKMLGAAAIMYANEHGDRLPPAKDWEEGLRPYIEAGYGAVEIQPPLGGKARRFAINTGVAEKKLDAIAPPEAVLFFESVSPGPSAADNLQSLPDLEKDGGSTYTIIYADGHGYIQPANWKALLHEPKWREGLLFGRPFR